MCERENHVSYDFYFEENSDTRGNTTMGQEGPLQYCNVLIYLYPCLEQMNEFEVTCLIIILNSNE